ncbi:hypothetical protein [Sphingomonas sp.]|uniref:hypothetical protein n=1 Tax=Sphingomonas sp. TaxID=28214 RepID=UPI001EB53386|nr:hypothetical protein [Sphingomonas sp.]MBX3593231.1 hypothetical protein [Sphingomonas sp.]
MSKLDWSKTSIPSTDPARTQKDAVDASVLATTPAAQKELKAARQARQEAARRAAKTRKLNRVRQQEKDRQDALDRAFSKAAEADFWTRLKDAMTRRNALKNNKK